jgi:hypothetical protein
MIVPAEIASVNERADELALETRIASRKEARRLLMFGRADISAGPVFREVLKSLKRHKRFPIQSRRGNRRVARGH